jgi:hypothetical protein
VVEPAQLQLQPVACRAGRGKQIARFHVFGKRPPGQFQRGGELGRLGRAESGQLRQFRRRRFGEPCQAAVDPGEQVAGEVDGALALDTDAQEDRQQFGIRERLRAERQQALARAFVFRPVGDCH